MTPHSTKRYLSLEELYSDFRLSNPYGEYQRTNAQQGVIPVFAKKIICGEEITIWGDGSVKRDFIYVGDVADAVVRLVENFNITGEINIGSGEATSVREIVERLEKITGRTAICRCEEARKCDVPVNCLSIERVRHVLQWQPVIDLDEGLRRTVSHLV